MAAERLQKLLAHAGVASRRAAEKMISEGRVRVNGRIVKELGVRADSRADRIEVDGRRIVIEKPVYYLVHKPRDVVTTLSDPEGRPHLGELLKGVPERVYPIGRLDYHSSGAVLVTNDGELAAALLSPGKKVPKIYAAKLRGHLDVPELDKLRRGVKLEDGTTSGKAEVFVIREEAKATWIQLTVNESKPRQIDRMALAIGHPLQRLVRTSFAGITTDGLRPGEHRELTQKEIDKLRKNYLRQAPAKKASRTDREA
jgi:23S rRNA pseudouridine2605 synthase